MGNWYDSIATLLITSKFHLEDGTTRPGPTHRDPKTLESWTPQCPDNANAKQRCSGTKFQPLVVNAVVAMVRGQQTSATSVGQCNGSKWLVVPGETQPSMHLCGIQAFYDIKITYKPDSKPLA